MARPTIAEQLKRQAATAEIVEGYSNAIVKVAQFIVVEGVTVASAVSIFRLSGKVYRYDKDGNETPGWAMRSALIDGMRDLRTMMIQEIPLIGIAPLKWMEPIVRAYEAMMNKVREDDGGYFFEPIPLIERMEIVILIPALLRTMLELMKGILSKG